jgi:hypothetical protein
MEENYSLKKIFIRGLISGIVFTALWSTWANYANLAHGADIAKKVSITQGSFTIINALSLIYVLVIGPRKLKSGLDAAVP